LLRVVLILVESPVLDAVPYWVVVLVTGGPGTKVPPGEDDGIVGTPGIGVGFGPVPGKGIG
jgi:hypothetical protein